MLTTANSNNDKYLTLLQTKANIQVSGNPTVKTMRGFSAVALHLNIKGPGF